MPVLSDSHPAHLCPGGCFLVFTLPSGQRGHPAPQGEEKQAPSSLTTPNAGSLRLLTLRTRLDHLGAPATAQGLLKLAADGAMPLRMAATPGSRELPETLPSPKSLTVRVRQGALEGGGMG